MVNRFKDKKVLIMGLGLHGGALAVVKWLLNKKAKLTITDIKTAKELKKSIDKIKDFPKSVTIKYTFGGHDLNDFKDQDLIVQNPGVPGESIYLRHARELKIPVVNEAVMFFGLYPGSSVGVTGTRGKSTTSSLIHHILKTEIKTNVVAGNIATLPMFEALDKLKVKSLPVIELSSWHLENMEEYKVSPHIAVVTNVLRDHLNRYKTFKNYISAKSAIVRYQVKRDQAVLNFDDKIVQKFSTLTKAQIYYFSLKKKVKGTYLKDNQIVFFDGKKIETIMPLESIGLIGRHNAYNTLAAITVAKLAGIKNENIAQAVSSFKGIDYRLEYKGVVSQRHVYNDSTSTTPDATLAAIEALTGKDVLLIAGGEDKELDYKKLAKVAKQKIKFIVLLSGTGSNKFWQELKKINYPSKRIIREVDKLSDAWKLAQQNSESGQTVLFSPAATSFNMFANEFDRARQFDDLLNDTP